MKQNIENYITKITSDRTGAVSYQVCIPYTNLDGYKDHYTATFSVKKYGGNAREALKAARNDRDKQLIIIESNPIAKVSYGTTVNTVFEQLPTIYSRSLRTWELYESAYNKFIKDSCGHIPIKKLRPINIQTSLNAMVSIATQDTIRRAAALWRLIIRGAIFMDYITLDPMAKVETPKSMVPPTYHRNVDMQPGAYEKVLWALLHGGFPKSPERMFDREMLACAMHVMYFTGIRPQECFMLSKSAFDFDKKIVAIGDSVGSTPDKKIARKTTKTKDSERYIPLVDDLIKVLVVWFQKQPSPLAFADHEGKLMETRIASQRVRWAAKRAGVEFNFYMLRHQLSTDLIIRDGIDPRTVMAIMGHNNVKQTLEYANVSSAAMRMALENRAMKECYKLESELMN